MSSIKEIYDIWGNLALVIEGFIANVRGTRNGSPEYSLRSLQKDYCPIMIENINKLLTNNEIKLSNKQVESYEEIRQILNTIKDTTYKEKNKMVIAENYSGFLSRIRKIIPK